MLIKNKEKLFTMRLTEDNFKKLVQKALDESHKRQKATSMTDIVTEFISKLK